MTKDIPFYFTTTRVITNKKSSQKGQILTTSNKMFPLDASNVLNFALGMGIFVQRA